MNFRSYFPLNSRVRPGEGASLLIAIVIYLGISAVAGLVSALLGWFPILGWVLRIVCWLIGVYCLAGIILSIVDFAKR